MHWILSENVFNEKGWEYLVGILERAGIPHSIHKIVPLVYDLIPEPIIGPNRKDVVCIGPYQMKDVALKNNWYPGNFDAYDFSFDRQRECWGSNEMLNGDGVICKFSEAYEKASTRPNAALDNEIFIRPVADSKFFDGKVIHLYELKEWIDKVVVKKEDRGTKLTGDTLVVMASVKHILTEYRFWIVENTPVAWSVYKRAGQFYSSGYIDDYIKEWVEEKALDAIQYLGFHNFPRTYVMDVALKRDGALRIVECGTFGACAFYSANMSAIVQAIESMRTDR